MLKGCVTNEKPGNRQRGWQEEHAPAKPPVLYTAATLEFRDHL